MLKNPLLPPPDMQHFSSDGGRIAIADGEKAQRPDSNF